MSILVTMRVPCPTIEQLEHYLRLRDWKQWAAVQSHHIWLKKFKRVEREQITIYFFDKLREEKQLQDIIEQLAKLEKREGYDIWEEIKSIPENVSDTADVSDDGWGNTVISEEEREEE